MERQEHLFEFWLEKQCESQSLQEEYSSCQKLAPNHYSLESKLKDCFDFSYCF